MVLCPCLGTVIKLNSLRVAAAKYSDVVKSLFLRFEPFAYHFLPLKREV